MLLIVMNKSTKHTQLDPSKCEQWAVFGGNGDRLSHRSYTLLNVGGEGRNKAAVYVGGSY